MGIYLDNKMVTPIKPDSKKEKADYTFPEVLYGQLKEIDKLFAKARKVQKGVGRALLIFNRQGFAKTWNVKKTSYKEVAPMAIPPVSSYYDSQKGMSYDLRYSKNSPVSVNGKGLSFPPFRALSQIKEQLIIDETQKDLAWYVIYCSPFVTNGTLVIHDKEKQLLGSVGEHLKQAEVTRMLLDENRTLEEMIAFVTKVFPGGVLNCDMESVKDIGVSAIQMAGEAEKKSIFKRSYGFDVLHKACRSLGLDKEKIKAPNNPTEVTLSDGKKIPFKPAVGKLMNIENLNKAAEEAGLPTEYRVPGKHKDEVHSYLKFIQGKEK
jgi:hypothetical protein